MIRTERASAHSAILAPLLLFCLRIVCGQQVPLYYNDLDTCDILHLQSPEIVAYKHSQTYIAQTKSYWSINQGHDIHSACRITPRSAADLQQIISIVSSTGTSFAVRSGGHSVVANTSNIEHGITIDLELLNQIIIDKEAGHIDIGTGARWKDVYACLEGTGFGVTGARAGSVGVGGFLLGGGLSIYSGQEGWACDSALLFEVVLANGTIVEASQDYHADLFRALKGSATNFGIMTRVRLRLVHDSPDVDATGLAYGIEQIHDVAAAIMQYNREADRDPLTSVGVSMGGTTNGPHLGISVFMTHPISVNTSLVLKVFFDIPHTVGSQTRMTQLAMAKFYDEMNPGGFRQFRTTTTVHNEARVFDRAGDELVKLFTRLVELNDATIQCGFLIQPLTLRHLHASSHIGAGPGPDTGLCPAGNILGLDKASAPLMLISFEIRYSDDQDSSFITSLGSQFMAKIEAHAAARKNLHAYRYLNYASAGQDVFRHIRSDVPFWSWLLQVKRSYDPHKIFGKQMLHSFKIGID